MNQKVIVIDGKVYKSIEEMPEEVRRQYQAALANFDRNNNGTLDMLENVNAFFQDKNQDGVPDAFDGLVSNVVTNTRIVADGKEYNSMEDLPPEVRAKLSQAMGKLDANQNGIPDFLEGSANPSIQTANVMTTFGTETPPRTPMAPVSSMQGASAIEPEPASSGWLIALAGLFIFMLCVAGAAAAWYFFLR